MRSAGLALVLAAAASLPACIVPMPAPRLTQVLRVNGEVYEALPGDTEVEVYLAKECRVELGKDPEFPVVSSIPDAKLIAIGKYWTWGGGQPRYDPNYPYIFVVVVPILDAVKKAKGAARRFGGDVIVIRVRGSDCGFFEVYRRNRGPGELRGTFVRPADP